MLDPATVAHALTDEQRAAFELDGYVVIPAALDEHLRLKMHDVALRHDAAFRREPEVGRHHILNEHDLVGKDHVWLDAIAPPAVFAKVLGIMGWNIQLFHTQLLVTPPAPSSGSAGPYGWHQDNNRMNRDFDTLLHPMVSVKVGYFLTDLATSGMGNLCVVPGSHRMSRAAEGSLATFRGSAGWPGDETPPHIEITARAGDAVIFDRRLWHSASTNTSDATRVFVTYGYSYRWLRPKSAMNFGAQLDTFDPILRQLLGWATSANGYFDPQPDDVPLRAWIEQHMGPDAVAP